MSRKSNDDLIAKSRARREAQYTEAMKLITESVHERFCPDSHDAASCRLHDNDQALIEHVLTQFYALPLHLNSAVLATIALRQSER